MLKRHALSIINQAATNRLLAIDAFRGITITAMILVNNPGSWSYVYWPLAHAKWHGWTPTDLIFPFFIFIVGLSISLSVRALKGKGMPNKDIVSKALVRMLKLVLLGWFLALFFYDFTAVQYNWFEDRLYAMRIMGVLQRIGIVYFVTIVAFLYLPTRFFYSLVPALLLIYAGTMLLVPYTDEQGIRYVGLLVEGNNLAAWLDNAVLTANHMYNKTATPFAYDPEGILSTIPAIATCISGVATGEFIANAKQRRLTLRSQIKWLFMVGLLLAVLGQLSDVIFPINKIIWTPSYVLLSSGLAILSLALCMFIIDEKRHKLWSAPFVVFGANAIAFFMFSGIVGRLVIMIPWGDSTLKHALYTGFFQPIFGNYNGSVAYAVGFLALSYAVFYHLYKRNIIWKV